MAHVRPGSYPPLGCHRFFFAAMASLLLVSTFNSPAIAASPTNSPASITLQGPVAVGYFPLSTSVPGIVTLHISWPLLASDGLVELLIEGKRVANFTWNGKQASAESNYLADLSALHPVDGKLVLELHSFLRDGASSRCSTRLQDAAVGISIIKNTGLPAVHTLTVSNFFQAPVSKLILQLPEPVTPEILGASANLVAAVISASPTHNISVEVEKISTIPLRRDLPMTSQGDSLRTVVMALGPRSGSYLAQSQNSPIMVIEGDGPGIIRQVAGIRSALINGSQSPQINVLAAADSPLIPTLTPSLSSLGVTTLSGAAIGSLRIPFGLYQSLLGGPVEKLSADIHGVSELAPVGSTVRIELMAGDHLLKSVLPDKFGRWMIRRALIDQDLLRYIDLSIVVNYDSTLGVCQGNETPLRTSIDADSSLRATLGATTTVFGFTRLPQALLPLANITIDRPTIERARQLLQLVAGMQRITPTPLHFLGLPPESAAKSSQPLVASVSYASPLAQKGLKVFIDRNGSFHSAADPVGVISAVNSAPLLSVASPKNSPTSRVILTSGAGGTGTADRLLAALGSDPLAWSRLSGDAATVTPDGAMQVFTLTPAQRTTPPSLFTGLLQVWWLWLLVGIALTGAAALVTRWFIWRRRGVITEEGESEIVNP